MTPSDPSGLLIVEDNPNDLELTLRALKKASFPTVFDRQRRRGSVWVSFSAVGPLARVFPPNYLK